MEIVDTYEPKFEGMEKMEQKRLVTAMDTVLSKDPLDEKSVGYQKPEPKEEPQPKPDKKDKNKKKPEEEKKDETRQERPTERRRPDAPQRGGRYAPRGMRGDYRGGDRGGDRGVRRGGYRGRGQRGGYYQELGFAARGGGGRRYRDDYDAPMPYRGGPIRRRPGPPRYNER